MYIELLDRYSGILVFYKDFARQEISLVIVLNLWKS